MRQPQFLIGQPPIHLSMKYHYLLLTFLLTGCFILAAGCAGTGGEATPTPTVTPAATQVPAVVSPVMILPELSGVTFEMTGKISPTESGNVELKLVADADRDIRKEGYNMRYTFFVYNTDAVEPGWYPKTYEDVINAGICYTTKVDKIYASNDRVLNVMLPRDSSIKTLDTGKPYVYGVIGIDTT